MWQRQLILVHLRSLTEFPRSRGLTVTVQVAADSQPGESCFLLPDGSGSATPLLKGSGGTRL